MIKLHATALVFSISPVIEVPTKSGTPFQKRELVLDDTWQGRDGAPIPNYVMIEFSGDRMAILDSFAPGQRVTVEAVVNGREANGRYFNSIRGLSVVPYQPQPQAQPQQPYQQQPYGGQPQQPFGQGYTPQPPRQPAMMPEQYPTYNTAPNYVAPQQPAYPQSGYPQQPGPADPPF